MSKIYRNPAVLDRVIDGDTVDLRVDLGYDVSLRQRYRLARINTAEMNSTGDSKLLAERAKKRLEQILKGRSLLVECRKTDRYGRYIAEVWVGVVNASDKLLSEGLAVAYEE